MTTNKVLGTVSTTHNGIFAQQMANLFTGLQEYKQNSMTTELAKCVREMFVEAVNHRRGHGVEDNLTYSYHASVSRYTPEQESKISMANTDIFMGITENKCRAFVSWVADILSNAEERPWTLKSTPIPDLPESIKGAIVDVLRQEVEANIGMDFDVEARIKELKQFAFKHAQNRADEAAMLHERKIHDQMESGNWRDAFDGFLVDLAWAPTAFIKAPVFKYEKKLNWRDGTMYETWNKTIAVERVDPRNVYPSPDSTTTQDGRYIFELKRMHAHQLKESAALPGFISSAIEFIIADKTGGYTDWVAAACSTSAPEKKLGVFENENKSPKYDVAIFYGRLPGTLLINFGLPVDPTYFYEAEVWLVGDTVIRAILNPHPLGKRPIEGCSFAPDPNNFWGRGIPLILKDIQRVCNAAARALVVNMGFSSGPIAEYDYDRLVNEDNVEQLTPYRVYSVESDASGGGHSAIRFNKIPSYASEFQAVYDRFSREADDISGIPAYVIGSPQVAGAGRTLGGLALLMGNAAKGIKRNLSVIDKRIIEPIVEKYYVLNMLYDDDASIKADAQIVARGSAGLLQRELSQARTVEVLSVLTPFISAGFIERDGALTLLRNVVNGLGYDADTVIPDVERANNIIQALQGQQFVNNPAANVQLDGRSAPAQNAIASLTPVPSPTGLPQGS